MLERMRASLREPDFAKGFALGIAVVVTVVTIAISVWLSGGPLGAPTKVLVENDRAVPVVVQLGDGRAWEVPADSWGPAVDVDFGTRATIYTATCERIADVVFHRGSGFIVNRDGTVEEVTFGDISFTTAPHHGCA